MSRVGVRFTQLTAIMLAMMAMGLWCFSCAEAIVPPRAQEPVTRALSSHDTPYVKLALAADALAQRSAASVAVRSDATGSRSITFQAVDPAGNLMPGTELAVRQPLRSSLGEVFRMQSIGTVDTEHATLRMTEAKLREAAGVGIDVHAIRIGAARVGSDAMYVTLQRPLPGGPIAVVVPHHGDVRVTVVDQDGKARTGSRVQLAATGDGERPPRAKDLAFAWRCANTRSDPDGAACFSGVAIAQRYELRASWGPHHATVLIDGPSLAGATIEATVVLDGPTTLVRGRACDATGEVLANTPLRLLVKQDLQARTTSDADGQFAFELPVSDLRDETVVLHELLGGTVLARSAVLKAPVPEQGQSAVDYDLGDVPLVAAEAVASGTLVLPEHASVDDLRLRVEQSFDGSNWRLCSHLVPRYDGQQLLIRGRTSSLRYRLCVDHAQCARTEPVAFMPGSTNLRVELWPAGSIVATLQLPTGDGHAPIALLLPRPDGVAAVPLAHTRTATNGARTFTWQQLRRGSYELQFVDSRTWQVVAPPTIVNVADATVHIDG